MKNELEKIKIYLELANQEYMGNIKDIFKEQNNLKR